MPAAISASVGFGFSSSSATAAMIMPARAVAALKRPFVEERLLDRVQRVSLGQALDGDDRLAVGARDRRAAGEDALPVHQHRAGAALALAAAVLGAGQLQLFAQDVEQRPVGVGRHGAPLGRSR